MSAAVARRPGLDLDLDLSCADGVSLPADPPVRQWLVTALAQARPAALSDRLAMAVRVVEAGESAALNQRYRDRAGPTNVLAFPAPPLPAQPAGEPVMLGDLVICASLVASEAAEQGKSWTAHFAHLLVHGSLHLLGFDHATDAEARAMEALETAILRELGFPDPYVNDDTDDHE